MDKLKTNELPNGLDQTFRNDLIDNFVAIQNGVDDQHQMLTKEIESHLGDVPLQDQNEVTQARVDFSGKAYPTLKGRIDDAEYTAETSLIEERRTSEEVSDARTNANSTTFETLKERLDSQENELTNDINYKISQISSVPEAFSSLVDLKNSYPNGKSGIFVTVDTGHKYVWSNGGWSDAGVYQSVGISDEQKDSIGDYLEKRSSLIGNFNAVPQGNTTIDNSYYGDGKRVTKATTQDTTATFSGMGWDISKYYSSLATGNGLIFDGYFTSTSDVREFGIGIAMYASDSSLIKSYVTRTSSLKANTRTRFTSIIPCTVISGTTYVIVTATATDALPSANVIYAEDYSLVKREANDFNNKNLINDYSINPQGNTKLSYGSESYVGQSVNISGLSDTSLTYNGMNVSLLDEIKYYKNNGYKFLNFSAKIEVNSDRNIEGHLASWDVNGKQLFDLKFLNMYVRKGDVIPVDTVIDISNIDISKSFSVLFSVVTPQTVDNSFEMNISNYLLTPKLSPVSLFKTLSMTTSQGLPYYSVDSMNNLIVQNTTTDTTKAWHGYYFDIRTLVKYLFSKKVYSANLKMEVSATKDSTYLIQTNYQNATDHRLTPIKEVNFVAGQSQWVDINIPISDPSQFPNTIQLVFTTPNKSIANNTIAINLSTATISSFSEISTNASYNGNHLPEIRVTGDVSGMSKKDKKGVQLDFINDGKTKTMFAKLKWQGDSSLAWPKKNYRMALFNDSGFTDKNSVRFFSDFPKDDKFNLKANYIDASHSRNIVNSRIFSKITSLRSDVNEVVAAASNFSQISGKPINLYINGSYAGLYSLNTYKNNAIFNFDKSNPNHFAVEAAKTSDATLFKSDTALLDGSDFELEYPDDVTDDIKTKLNRLLKFANSATDDEFAQHQNEYINVNSFIDYILFNALIMNDDGLGKNAIYETFDGNIWYALPYDLDSTWRLYWDGTKLVDINTNYLMPNQNRNKLFTRVINANKDALKARWSYLRTNVLRADNIINEFDKYYNSVGQENYEQDRNLWPNIPSIDLTDFNQLRGDIYTRLNVSDKQVNDL